MMIKGGIAAAMAAIGLLVAPQAQAEGQLEYLQMLNYRGLTVYDTATALQTGYQICDMLNYEDGTAVVAWMVVNKYQYTPYDMPIAIASAWMHVAVQELCPWQDHRNEI